MVEKIKEYLKENLSDYRYNHCLNVANVSQSLARHYYFDEEKAYIAGLIHDIAKEMSEDENKMIIEKYNLSMDLLNKNNKKNLHADIGSVLAKELFNLPDDICKAVKNHTFGNVDMNILDMIVYVADKIEPGKNYVGIEEERNLAYIDIKDSMILCIENKIKKLINENKKINKRTYEVLEYLKSSL